VAQGNLAHKLLRGTFYAHVAGLALKPDSAPFARSLKSQTAEGGVLVGAGSGDDHLYRDTI
jgi:hypothetical protein